MDKLVLSCSNEVARRLPLDRLVQAARDPEVKIVVPDEERDSLRKCRKGIDAIVNNYKAAYANEKKEDFRATPVVDLLRYGITTGFGEFKDKPIEPNDLDTLQERILLSHSVGVGYNHQAFDPANYYSGDVVRATLILRLQTFLKGHSGVRETTLDAIIWMLNHGIVPLVPIRGSVGSSGDLAPLSHLFVTFLGKGHFYKVKNAGELHSGLLTRPVSDSLTQLEPPKILPATAFVTELCAELRINGEELKPKAKEGLALTNGATFSAAMLAMAVYDAEILADTADAAASLTLEAICGNVNALDERVHRARGHIGQIDSAANMRRMLQNSSLTRAPNKTKDVQDCYSVRCAPAVNGATRDAIAFAKTTVTAEINAVTDNPLVFDESEIKTFTEKEKTAGLTWDVFSASNFHGQPIGMAADFLAIAVAELGNIAERRTQMLLDEHHSRNLPGNLIADQGLNSGFMIAQYTAASLVSENKIYCHPSSVDSIPTSANVEDHVAMATTAGRKAQIVVNTSRMVLAIELLVAAQAMEWRMLSDDGKVLLKVAGRKTKKETHEKAETKPGEVRAALGLQKHFESNFGASLQADSCGGPSSKIVADSMGAGTGKVYRAIREHVPALVEDVYLGPLVQDAIEVVATGSIAKILRSL